MNAHDVTLAILTTRAFGATVCPSEVAQAMAASASVEIAELDWRAAMPAVHTAIDELVAEGQVRLNWKGKILPLKKGPYRIELLPVSGPPGRTSVVASPSSSSKNTLSWCPRNRQQLSHC